MLLTTADSQHGNTSDHSCSPPLALCCPSPQVPVLPHKCSVTPQMFAAGCCSLLSKADRRFLFMKTVLSIHGEWLCSGVSCCACLHVTVNGPCLTNDSLVALVMWLGGGEEIFSIFLFSSPERKGLNFHYACYTQMPAGPSPLPRWVPSSLRAVS